MKRSKIHPLFVEFIPDHIEEGVLYISEQYQTAIHKCFCGCGEEIVTPLSPVDWLLKKECGTVTLSPSIGNWNYPCQSHYWIRRNSIHWSSALTKQQIRLVQARDKSAKELYAIQANAQKFGNTNTPNISEETNLKGNRRGAWLKWIRLKVPFLRKRNGRK